MIVEQRPITLPFIGARDYLHGPDLFYALAEFLDLPADAGPLNYSIHNFIRTNHALLVQVEQADQIDRKTMPTLLIAQTPDGPRVAAIGPDPSQSGARQERPSDEAEVIAASTQSDTTITAPYLADVSPLEQAVLMNKALLSTLLPDLAVKWAFTRADFTAPLPARAAQIQVECETPRPGRLYRSRLHIDGHDYGTIFFSGIAI